MLLEAPVLNHNFYHDKISVMKFCDNSGFFVFSIKQIKYIFSLRVYFRRTFAKSLGIYSGNVLLPEIPRLHKTDDYRRMSSLGKLILSVYLTTFSDITI